MKSCFRICITNKRRSFQILINSFFFHNSRYKQEIYRLSIRVWQYLKILRIYAGTGQKIVLAFNRFVFKHKITIFRILKKYLLRFSKTSFI